MSYFAVSCLQNITAGYNSGRHLNCLFKLYMYMDPNRSVVFMYMSYVLRIIICSSQIGQTIEPKCSFWLENNSWVSKSNFKPYLFSIFCQSNAYVFLHCALFRLPGDYGGWSTKGCSSKFENNSHIKCECSHFTNFAVLFRISDEKVWNSKKLYTIFFVWSIINSYVSFLEQTLF